MSDEWMPSLKLNLTRAEFDAIPRHPAFKYELIQGKTYVSPWPRYAHARLRLRRFRAATADLGKANLRLVQPSDLAGLVPAFRSAFARQQPIASLSDEIATKAAEKSLQFTFDGNDGPLAEPASFVALHDDEIVGAILITLLPGGDDCDWGSLHWHDPPPPDLWQKGEGQPHLTWIFVKHFEQGDGIGTQLLHRAVRALKKQGYAMLWTTFMIGNDSSLRWHWRNGFELLPNGLSKRRLRMRVLK
jgi:GNAT superfamily N-acetyltransferase